MKLEKLELIAIHIKKTGGMSFKELLKKQYGNNYFRVNTPRREFENRNEEVIKKLGKLNPTTQVIHGHFRFEDMKNIIDNNPDVPVVTWLREPVQRVISQYYYSKRKFGEGLRQKHQYLGEISLLEYANQKYRKNGMSRMLTGIDLADMKFVGLLEHVQEDFEYVINLFGWKPLPLPKKNTNTNFRSKYPPPTAEEIEEISHLNQKDIALYKYGQELREKRIRHGL